MADPHATTTELIRYSVPQRKQSQAWRLRAVQDTQKIKHKVI
jgi:hypothetical protein